MSEAVSVGRRRTRVLVAALVALVLGLAVSVVGPTAAQAAAGTSRLNAGERLQPGERLTSPSGKLSLIMQGDGNLVLYAPGGSARWFTGTDDNPGAYAVMQGDGNFVVYTAAGKALWSSQTNGSGAAFVQVQDDGNVVAYTSAPKSVWQTGTRYAPSRLNAGGSLAAGQRLQSPNGAYNAVMQADGNFVLYGPGGVMWHAGTNGSGANRLAVQTDGNMVLYNAANQWKWQTYTNGKPGGFLQVQDDGNMVLYDSSSKWIWQTYTYPGYVPPAPAPDPTTAKIQQAITYATQQLGKPYLYGGTGPGSFDCSGLTSQAWASAGVAIPRTAAAQYAGLRQVPVGQIRAGDIVAFHEQGNPSKVTHVALYIGDSQMIEARRPGTVISVTALRSNLRMPMVLRPVG